jgi:hypothetical protein
VVGFSFKQGEDAGVAYALGLDAVEALEGLGLVGKPPLDLVVDAVLLLLLLVQLAQHLPLGHFQLVVPLLQPQQFFEASAEVALILEVHLVELPAVLNAKELRDLLQTLLPSALEFFQDVFDALDVLDLLVLGGLPLFDLAVEHVVVLLLRVEQRLHLLHVVGRLSTHEALQSLLDTVKLAADLKHFAILLL